jgi:xylose isomerase
VSTGFFGDIGKIPYEGEESTNPLAFRFYQTRTRSCSASAWRIISASPSAYWHTFVWPGGDPFGGQTFERPWFAKDGSGDTMEAGEEEGGRRLRDVLHCSGSPFTPSMTPTCVRKDRASRKAATG